MAGPTLDLGNLLIHFRADISQYTKMMKTVESKMRATSRALTRIGSQMSLRVTAPIIAMGTASVKAFANFDDAITKSLAIMSNITPQIRQEMESLALTISEQGVTSATNLAKSYFFLASAGLDAKQSMAALGAVNDFAIAGAFDMATATDLATDAQSALGLTVKDAEQNLINMTRVTDVLTGANTLANASTEQFALALTSQAGPAMKAYGIELEEGVAVLAAFADQGIKAQNAGNLFSRMLRLMTKGFMDNTTAWKRFNINIFDATGNLKPMATIIGDLSNAIGNLSPKAKIAALDMLGFQARSQQAILPLLGMQDAIAGYVRQLKEMNGITKEVADKQLKSFASQMTILKNQIVNVGREIGSILAPHIIKLNEKIKDLIKSWKELSSIAKKWIVITGLIVAAIGPTLIILGTLIKLFLFMKVAVVLATGVLVTFAKAFAVMGVQMLLFHPMLTLVLVLLARLTQLAFEYNKIQTNFIKLNGLLIESNDLLKQHNKLWKDIADTIKQTAAGRIVATQVEVIERQLRQKLEQLKFLKDDFDNLNFFDKFLQGPVRQSVINRLTLEVAVFEKRLKTLGKLGEAEFKRIEKAADMFVGPPAPDAPAKKKPFFEFDTDIFDKKMQEWVDSARDLSNNIAGAFITGLDTLSQGITAALFGAKVSFAAIAESIARDVTAQVIRSVIANAVSATLNLGGDMAAATVNATSAAENTAAALVNQTSAATNLATANLNIAASTTEATLSASNAIENATTAAINTVAATTNTTAALINQTAAATMLTAATINAGASAGGVLHSGGMVGRGGVSRTVPASTFIGAPRLHRGLADNEFASILERGEVVLNKNNVAELKDGSERNGGGGGSSIINNFNISAIDQRGVAQFFRKNRKQISSAMRKSRGENNPIRRGQS